MVCALYFELCTWTYLMEPYQGTNCEIQNRVYNFSSFSFSQRESICFVEQSQLAVLKSIPQLGQSPLQSALHRTWPGIANIISSLTISSSSIPSPSKAERS